MPPPQPAPAKAKPPSEKKAREGGARAGEGAEPFDVRRAPGAEMLSPKERELCAAMRLLPKHYLVIKARDSRAPPTPSERCL